MIIRIKNDLATEAQKSYTASPMEAGTTKLTVVNHSVFTDDWAVQLGETGEAKTEIKNITSVPSAGTFGIGTLSYDHPTDTPVYAIRYDQVIFKRATAGTSGTATAMTGGTVNITPNSEFTQFDDTSGSTSYGYRASFYSSGLSSEGATSDWLTPAGHDFYSLGKVRQRIKSKAQNGDQLLDDEIDDWVNEWMERMTATATKVNQDYNLGTVDVGFSGTAEYGTITSADFKQVRRAWYTEDSSNWYTMTKENIVDFEPTSVYNETAPYYHMRGDSEIGRNPHDNSGTIRLTYYKLNPVLDSDGDNLPVPMRGYTNSFVDWGLAQAKRKEGKETEALQLEAKAEGSRQQFEAELTPRNQSGSSYIKIVEGWDSLSSAW